MRDEKTRYISDEMLAARDRINAWSDANAAEQQQLVADMTLVMDSAAGVITKLIAEVRRQDAELDQLKKQLAEEIEGRMADNDYFNSCNMGCDPGYEW